MRFNRKVLNLDPARETQRIVQFLQQNVRQQMRRHGGVVGISGGIDSAVVLGLSVRAFGPTHVVAVMMPDQDSDPLSEELARELAARFGLEPRLENITGALQGFNCYQRRDEAIRGVVPSSARPCGPSSSGTTFCGHPGWSGPAADTGSTRSPRRSRTSSPESSGR